MTRDPLAAAVLLSALVAAQSSCGGASHDLPRPAAAARRDPPPALAVVRARAAKPAHATVRAPVELPIPGDAWAGHVAGEQAARASFEQRFPLHGIAFHVLAQIFSEPNERGQVIGYMRRGTRFRAATGKPGRGCEHDWYELASGGFVCEGRGFAIGKQPQSFEPSPPPAALHDPLPYAYAKNVAKAELQYWRIPSVEEERAALRVLAEAPEALLRAPAAVAAAGAAEAGAAPGGLPGVTPALGAESAEVDAAAPELALPEFARMPMQPGFYVSVDRTELADASGQVLPEGQRAFVRTVRGAYVPAAALAPATAPAGPGVVLDAALALPIGIVYRSSAAVLERDAAHGAWEARERLPRFAHVALSGARVEHERAGYLVTRSGALVSEPQLRVVERATRPPLVPKRARLIHVRLATQTLVAYDGERPVFATLVATGKQGYETPTGVFRIHAKHVSATMDGLAGSDEVYSIEDVPWTMYFDRSYALHAAFWHDRLGSVRSHGCVNLSPDDARWLFRWTTPVLPAGWHGAVATPANPGTWVWIE